MLRKLSYITICIFIIGKFGHNVFGFSDGLQKDFYFISMALANLGFAFIISKLIKSKVTMFFLAFSIAALINEVFFQGRITIFEIGMTFILMIILSFNDGKNR